MTVAPNDRGLTLGDGLFETILAEEGLLVLWDEHMARLQQACVTLGIPAPDPDLVQREAVAALDQDGVSRIRAAVRVTWTAGEGGRGLDRPHSLVPRLIVTAAAAPTPSGPVSLATSTIRRNETSPASRLKTLSYLDQVLARREAAAAGAEEALMLNGRGEVACAAAANIFWIENGVLNTPALDCGVLDGVMRAVVLARAPMPVIERRAMLDALATAEAVFLTNSLIGVRQVSSVDGVAIGGEDLVRQIAAAVL